MTDIQKRLFELSDSEYAAFQAKLTPTVPQDRFIGVRVPILRKFAKEYCREPQHEDFLNTLPHEYFDENMLHALLIERIKDFDTCIKQTERFLPYVDNWAVCDIMSPKVFAKNKPGIIEKIKEWAASDDTYTIRFGIEMLMSHFLDADFNVELLEIPARVRSEEYYVNMMTAWFFATALCKQWDAAIPYIENRRLDKWTHNKTVQKAIESNRITDEQKAYLRGLKL